MPLTYMTTLCFPFSLVFDIIVRVCVFLRDWDIRYSECGIGRSKNHGSMAESMAGDNGKGADTTSQTTALPVCCQFSI